MIGSSKNPSRSLAGIRRRVMVERQRAPLYAEYKRRNFGTTGPIDDYSDAPNMWPQLRIRCAGRAEMGNRWASVNGCIWRRLAPDPKPRVYPIFVIDLNSTMKQGPLPAIRGGRWCTEGLASLRFGLPCVYHLATMRMEYSGPRLPSMLSTVLDF